MYSSSTFAAFLGFVLSLANYHLSALVKQRAKYVQTRLWLGNQIFTAVDEHIATNRIFDSEGGSGNKDALQGQAAWVEEVVEYARPMFPSILQ